MTEQEEQEEQEEEESHILGVRICWTVQNLPALVCEESVPEAEDVRKWKLLQSKIPDFRIGGSHLEELGNL